MLHWLRTIWTLICGGKGASGSTSVSTDIDAKMVSQFGSRLQNVTHGDAAQGDIHKTTINNYFSPSQEPSEQVELSENAKRLLALGSHDEQGKIYASTDMHGRSITTWSTNLMNSLDPREWAEWQAVLDELLQNGAITVVAKSRDQTQFRLTDPASNGRIRFLRETPCSRSPMQR